MWWQVLVIPATWEAEKEEWLEPGRQMSQLAEIMSLHSSLMTETIFQKKKKREKENKWIYGPMICVIWMCVEEVSQ